MPEFVVVIPARYASTRLPGKALLDIAGKPMIVHVADRARALTELFAAKSEVRIIGTRHGEKLYESLISREEMAHAQDLGDYYRIPADNRDLNYAKYFSEGDERIAEFDDYTSHNSRRLNIEQIKALLLKLDYIKEQLND